MAASIYATPPPDLSGEDTALSDVSNSSQLSNSSSQSKKAKAKRSISEVLLSNPSSATSSLASVVDALQFDQSKKRRKQTTPIRISALNLSADGAAEQAETEEVGNEENENETPQMEGEDFEDKLSKMFLPKFMGQINPFDLLQTNISSSPPRDEFRPSFSDMKQCKECGEMFDSDLKLSVHVLHEHHSDEKAQDAKRGSISIIPPERMKLEKPDSNEPQLPQSSMADMMPKAEPWMMPGLGFPFPHEALAPGGYLSQMPMLGVPPYPSVDGLSRPPLRIFNPEAYCDLCNKEFCNKYFLKTHKANKHGIYDPVVPTSDPNSTSSMMNSLNQAFQMQYQQEQAQHIQPLSPKLQGELDQQPAASVYCDVCNKRFNNIFAMKRHRSKAHEIPPPQTAVAASPPEIKAEAADVVSAPTTNDKADKAAETPLRMPEGFREDYNVEQEDVSFTPQPRKMSPSSQQLAREANFSFDKLKRLGVINPEAFCDICCKEYCNKYFLRTHKWKRHGVFMPADDAAKESTSASTSASTQPQWPFMPAAPSGVQTTPLNLMMVNEKLQRQFFEGVESKRMKLADENEKSDDKGETSHVQDSELVGLNIQKLQSMILQLNDLNGKRPVACHICGKELENNYVLQAHIATEHGLDNNNGNYSSFKQSPLSSPTTAAASETCKQCDREFPTAADLKQHILEVHSMKLDSPLREGFITPERPVKANSTGPTTPAGQQAARPQFTMTPTSSYCEICNKELCNKYFMKTHMQRMHGIEIENGAQIGGVVCNICNKELCSKYFLRVHKHNTHGIIDEGAPLPPAHQARINGEQAAEAAEPMYPLEPKIEITDGSSRYFTHYTEVCPICSRRFRSAKWLRAHLMGDHGQVGLDKLKELEQQLGLAKPPSPTLKIPNGGMAGSSSNSPNMLQQKNPFSRMFKAEGSAQPPRFKEYQCSMCPFTTPYIPFLFIHERSHSIMNYSATSPPLSQAPEPAAPTPAVSSAPPSPTTSTHITASSPPPPPQAQPQAAQSEPDALLAQIANQTNRPAAFALPKSFDGEQHQMQTFLIEQSGDSADSANRFVPAVVYLPVRERATGPITVSFTLTPA